VDVYEKMEELKDLLEVAREDGDAPAEAAALLGIGRVYLKDKTWDRAADFLGQCVAVCRAAGLREDLARALLDHGDAKLALEETDRAQALYKEAAEIFKEIEQPQGRARALDRLAEAALIRDDGETSLAAAREALAVCLEHGDKVGAVYFLERALPLLKQAGRIQETAEAYRELITQAEGIGDRERMALGLVGLADVYEKTGQPTEAVPCLKMAHDLYLRLGKEREAGLILTYLDRVTSGLRNFEK